MSDTSLTFDLHPTSAADRTYIARLNFLTDIFGDEHEAVSPAFDDDFQFYAKNWDPQDGGYVAWCGNIPAGGVWILWGNAESHGSGFVDESIPELAIAVEPRYRGAGLASQLINAATDLAKELGAPAISLCVDPRNENARAVYQHLGFEDADDAAESDMLVMIRKF